MTNQTHVYPPDDLLDHDTQSLECWCDPRIDEVEGLIVHNAFDGRD